MTFDRAYRASLYAVAIWGYTALYSTGEFGTLLIGTFYALIFLAAFLRRRGIIPTILQVNLLTAVVFGALLVLAGRSLLDATVYFFMFLQIIKLYTNRTTTDALWVYVIAFFQVIAAAVLTTSVGFAVVFVVYLALMVASLVLLTVRRSQEVTETLGARARAELFRDHPVLDEGLVPAGAHRPAAFKARLSRGFFYFSGLVALAILGITIGFFLVIPRLSTQKLFQTIGQRAPARESVSAFDESIEFGTLEKINLDSSVALFVRPMDPTRPSYVRLRGVALDTFDGRRWLRTTRAVLGERHPYEPFHRRVDWYPSRRYLMIQPPNVTNYLFGDTFPESVRLDLDQQVTFDPWSNSAWLPSAVGKEFHYTVVSRTEESDLRRDPAKAFRNQPQMREERQESPLSAIGRAGSRGVTPSLLGMNPLAAAAAEFLGREGQKNRAAGDRIRWQPGSQFEGRFRIPADYRMRCLRLPESLDRARVQALAEEWSKGAESPFEIARAVEAGLRRNYRYSLTPKAKGNVIESFLFETREGHCEYFATSMVVMMRALGIPARIVNGYYSAEWNEIGKAFTVRQRDAHSWVEVYFDSYGWMSFDPTPPNGVGRTGEDNVYDRTMGRMVDALKVRWYRYMIDYNFTDQIGIVRSVLNATFAVRELLARVSEGLRRSDWPDANPERGGNLLVAAMVLGGGLALTCGLFWLLRPGRFAFGRRKHAARRTLVRFYADIQRALRRFGLERDPGETPREFAARVTEHHPPLELLRVVTETYYAVRFNGQDPRPEQWEDVDRLRRTLREYRPGRN